MQQPLVRLIDSVGKTFEFAPQTEDHFLSLTNPATQTFDVRTNQPIDVCEIWIETWTKWKRK
jgi:hypothetical protein